MQELEAQAQAASMLILRTMKSKMEEMLQSKGKGTLLNPEKQTKGEEVEMDQRLAQEMLPKKTVEFYQTDERQRLHFPISNFKFDVSGRLQVTFKKISRSDPSRQPRISMTKDIYRYVCRQAYFADGVALISIAFLCLLLRHDAFRLLLPGDHAYLKDITLLRSCSDEPYQVRDGKRQSTPISSGFAAVLFLTCPEQLGIMNFITCGGNDAARAWVVDEKLSYLLASARRSLDRRDLVFLQDVCRGEGLSDWSFYAKQHFAGTVNGANDMEESWVLRAPECWRDIFQNMEGLGDWSMGVAAEKMGEGVLKRAEKQEIIGDKEKEQEGVLARLFHPLLEETRKIKEKILNMVRRMKERHDPNLDDTSLDGSYSSSSFEDKHPGRTDSGFADKVEEVKLKLLGQQKLKPSGKEKMTPPREELFIR